jgi:O-antigen ligase
MHNGYLSVLAGTGVVGFALWVALLAVPYARAWRVRSGGRKGLVAGIMTMGLAANLVESQITPAASVSAAMFWIAWAVAGRLAAGVRTGPASPLRTGTGGEVAA